MNYRRLFFFAVVLNVAIALVAFWIWKSSRPSIPSKSAVEHPPMEGFTVNTPPEGSAPPLTPVELSSERMQSIGVRTGQIEYKTINSDIRATGTVDVDERRVAYVQTRYPGWVKDVLVCYRCNAHYRGFVSQARHQPFDLGIGERYRQEKARREQLLGEKKEE